MPADKQIEELGVDPLGILHNLPHLQARLDIEIIADMTGLQIEVKEADPAAAGPLVELDLHRSFERERGVADAATARHEGQDRGPDPLDVGGAGLALARTGN